MLAKLFLTIKKVPIGDDIDSSHITGTEGNENGRKRNTIEEILKFNFFCRCVLTPLRPTTETLGVGCEENDHATLITSNGHDPPFFNSPKRQDTLTKLIKLEL